MLGQEGDAQDHAVLDALPFLHPDLLILDPRAHHFIYGGVGAFDACFHGMSKLLREEEMISMTLATDMEVSY